MPSSKRGDPGMRAQSSSREDRQRRLISAASESESAMSSTVPKSSSSSSSHERRYATHTFQHPSNAMRMTVRHVDLSSRVAFHLGRSSGIGTTMSSASLRDMLDEMDRVRGSRIIVGDAASVDTSGTNGGGSAAAGGGGTSGSKRNPCRISPSPNHLAILELMHGYPTTSSSTSTGTRRTRTRVVRQLHWNPACGTEADPWWRYDGGYSRRSDDIRKGRCEESRIGNTESRTTTSTTTTTTTTKSKTTNMSNARVVGRRNKKNEDGRGRGRYVPIDAYASLRSSLPDHSPILTNSKRRLPSRSDVGFANPSPDDVRTKMDEVRREAEWEESSPRIALLGSGFMLFARAEGESRNDTEAVFAVTTTTTKEEETDGSSSRPLPSRSPRREDGMDVDELHPSCKEDIRVWAGGGSIPGVPFAGRNLVHAYQMEKIAFERAREEEEARGRNMNDEMKNDAATAKEGDVCVDDGGEGGRMAAHDDVEWFLHRIARDPRSYSVFAPPVDSTFSSLHQWRPRPFMDRPPGHVHFLACPLDIRLGDMDDDAEPYFCTMALYALPKNQRRANQQRPGEEFCGKISEDFFFPAGNWSNIEEGGGSSFDDDDDGRDDGRPQSWRRRKRRAIMSYDPLEVSPQDLYLVIQVHRGNSQLNENTCINRSKDSIIGTASTNQQRIASSALPLEEVGVQFLMPVCFSVTPAFCEKNETTQRKRERSTFFGYPDIPESHEDFLKRLACIANPPSSSPTKSSSNIGGYSDLFTSYLGGDFMRALLDEPPPSDINDDAPTLGLLLADVTGECAVSHDVATSKGGNMQRSNLRRLPPSQESGYSSSFDLKEVLYFPPRSLPRNYDDDSAIASSTVLNLLYIYPRLIRWTSSHVGNNSQSNHWSSEHCFAIRIQVVEQELPLDPTSSHDNSDTTYQALPAIYNASSPVGPPLVESFYTKAVKNHMDDRMIYRKSETNQIDIPLKDEVKVRLPDILDRRHFLLFSLFAIGGNGQIEQMVANTAIPFIISSKESVSGTRVTSIIPNGLHRIQLSDGIQIQVETRLASSFHVSDPKVATLLRDFPQLMPEKIGIDPSRSASEIILCPHSGSQFLDILVMASAQAVKRHSLCLLTVNMLNLLSQIFDIFGSGDPTCEKTNASFTMIRSLFEILDKTRTFYEERDCCMLSLQYLRLVKSFLDAFDEHFFEHRHTASEGKARHFENGHSIDEKHFNVSQDSSRALNDDGFPDGPFSSLTELTNHQGRIAKYRITSPKNEMATKSFSRKAFVATRSEQLKAETELNNDDAYHVREYFEDDATVATFGTMLSRADSGAVFPFIVESRSFSAKTQDDILRSKSSSIGMHEEAAIGWTCGSGIVRAKTPRRSPTQAKTSTPFSFSAKRAEDMANRVNSMARLVIAPCIAPPLDDTSPLHKVNGTLNNGKVAIARQMMDIGSSHSPFEPSSDVEEEGKTTNIAPFLRGNQSCLKVPPLVFHPIRKCNDTSWTGKGLATPFLYEVIFALWVECWTSLATSTNPSHSQIHGTSNDFPHWPYELIQGSYNATSDSAMAFSFTRNVAFFLPLCLKSLGMRCARIDTSNLNVPMTFLDDNHIQILVAVVETIALGLMRQALRGNSGNANADKMLTRSLIDGESVMDFLIGVLTFLHPTQAATFIHSYFNILEECENVSGKAMYEAEGSAKKSHLRLTKCSRQLRLHAVERLAAIPAFSKLNFPIKFRGTLPGMKSAPSSWTSQWTGKDIDDDMIQKYLDEVHRFPPCFWLSKLMTNQCLSICSSSCKMIQLEAEQQDKAEKQGTRKVQSVLLRDDLLRIESMAFHSILIAYQLLIKRQAMDSRFQAIASTSRVAALFTSAVIRNSVDAVLVLARMDHNNRIRVIWVLSLLYILQEGPDAIIRNELRQLSKDKRMNDFIALLKLAGSTCQHFILKTMDSTSGEVSLPVLGGLSKEITQESYNCISASVILCVDEYYHVVSSGKYEPDATSIFDALLHLLVFPQSSVTHLRTLGSCAYALDKFGVPVFLKSVDSRLQHWGRIIFTLMNSTELSVRSMAVDFLVSLLCGVYDVWGSIDSISLCFLSILPEIVAREIALFSVSGLIKSMENVESSLWPLRRAIADVEESNPFDDDRVNPQMLPSLTTLCRTAQAIIDGVLVEVRLRDYCNLDLDEISRAQRGVSVGGLSKHGRLPAKAVFDADEESVLEAASFFSHETSLSQKLRWLFTLRDIHFAKRQWSEVAEVMTLCAQSLIKSYHLLPQWEPCRFDLWNDYRHSPWLSSIGVLDSHYNRGNISVMEFANAFLELNVKIRQREILCSTLISVVDFIAAAHAEEDGIEGLAFLQFEGLLSLVNDESTKHKPETHAYLRHVRAAIYSKLAKITDYGVRNTLAINISKGSQIYVLVILQGHKPFRFQESTTIPTFFEWDVPSICRISKPVLEVADRIKQQHPKESWEECICQAFTTPLIVALRDDDVERTIVLRTKASIEPTIDKAITYITAMVVQKIGSEKSRKFIVRHSQDCITEYTVAHKFPHCLSRQRSLVTSEIKMASQC